MARRATADSLAKINRRESPQVVVSQSLAYSYRYEVMNFFLFFTNILSSRWKPVQVEVRTVYL